ncbi:hypothetical protein ACH4OY_25260 [Micromonospora rubida]|uniref:Uncharacterized protein n=1 Tax=Micromonospora rubida TaxID=2697657 RepID=A0ABW7SQH3_9ACTN
MSIRELTTEQVPARRAGRQLLGRPTGLDAERERVRAWLAGDVAGGAGPSDAAGGRASGGAAVGAGNA